MRPNFNPDTPIKRSRYWGVPRKCNRCDHPAKRNLRPDGKNKGYYKTCGSATCLTAQYRDVAINGRKAWRATFICECCKGEYTAKCRKQRWCYVCIPDKASRSRMQRYGISYPAYQQMLKDQNNLCYLCKEKFPSCVDHNHATNQVRKLLCDGCNTKLSGIDDVNWLTSALTYITDFGIK